MDSTRKDDIFRINALVDGELAPSDRAAIAARIAADRDLARVHATLARLKAAVVATGELGDMEGDMELARTPPQRRSWRPALGLAASLGALGLVTILLGGHFLTIPEPADPAPHHQTTMVTLATLPSGIAVPALDHAGLRLADLAVETPQGITVVHATYRGPHGCQLDLRARPVGGAIPAIAGSSRHEWDVGGIAYELVAHGMPQWRFAIIADVTEQQTRQGGRPLPVERLREARLGAPPCTG